MPHLQQTRKSSRTLALLAWGLLTCTVSTQQAPPEDDEAIAAWISQLADPNRRTAAAIYLVRAGRSSARPLSARLLAGWPSAVGEQQAQARTIAVQVLCDLGAKAVDSFANLVRYYEPRRAWPERTMLLGLLGRLIAQNPRAALRALDDLQNQGVGDSFDELYEHAQWAKDAGQYDLIERLRQVYGDWRQRILVLSFIAERAATLLADNPVTRADLDAELTSMLRETSPQYNQHPWRSITSALARIGSRKPAAAGGHVTDLVSIDPRRRVAALQSLARFDQLTGWAMAAIIARLDDAELMVVREAVTTLGIAIRHTPGCIGALERAARHDDAQVRRRAKAALEPLRRSGQLPETATWWWPDGRIASRGPLRKGIIEGRWEFFWTNGSIRSAGEYRAGAEHGPWQFWYEDRQPSGEGSFAQGKRVGKWITWHENGGPKNEGSYDRGLATGPWIGWHENGKVAWVGEFLADRRHGHWTLRHPNRALLGEGDYVDGQRVGQWALFDQQGRALSKESDFARLLGEPKTR